MSKKNKNKNKSKAKNYSAAKTKKQGHPAKIQGHAATKAVSWKNSSTLDFDHGQLMLLPISVVRESDDYKITRRSVVEQLNLFPSEMVLIKKRDESALSINWLTLGTLRGIQPTTESFGIVVAGLYTIILAHIDAMNEVISDKPFTQRSVATYMPGDTETDLYANDGHDLAKLIAADVFSAVMGGARV